MSHNRMVDQFGYMKKSGIGGVPASDIASISQHFDMFDEKFPTFIKEDKLFNAIFWSID